MKAHRRTLGALALAASMLFPIADARAQQLCVLHDSAVSKLADQYGEQVAARGLVAGGKAVAELFVSEAGTWTVVVTDVEGRSCIVASGRSWTPVPLLVGDPA